jgi:hypothetical protein
VSSLVFSITQDNSRRFLYPSVRLPNDGRMLFILIIAILFSPYLPPVPIIGAKIRVDNVIVPFTAVFVFLRATMGGRIAVNKIVSFYFAFLIWLLLMTFITNSFTSGDQRIPFATYLAGIDAYSRPLFLLFIASNVIVNKADFLKLLKVVLVSSAILCIIAIMQLIPKTATLVNKYIILFYDNGRSGNLIQLTLAGGRAMSIFGQVGTFGMFCLLCFALIEGQLLGARILKSNFTLLLLFVLVFAGGVISGSKVFSGGFLFLIAFLILRTDVLKNFLRIRYVFLVMPILTVGFIYLQDAFSTPFSSFFSRVAVFDASVLYERYLSSRLGELGGDITQAKLYRTGAWDTFLDHPIAGVGFGGIGKTTDSFLLGILVMGGIVGGILYLFSIGALLRRLRIVIAKCPDLSIAILAKIMFFLTVIFLIGSIGFHTFIQDRAGDLYWLITGLLISPSLSIPARSRVNSE